jgi:hypothetical protein
MTKTAANTPAKAPAFSAKTAAAAWVEAQGAPAKKKIRAAVAATAKVSSRKRWAALLKDIDANDKVRVKARATGDWSAVNAARPVTPAKPKAKAKAKAKAPVAAEAVSAVDAAMALATLVGAGKGASAEAGHLIAFIRNA